MSKAFKKGQQVTFIQSWDNKGTVTYRQAVVHSCGTKQMILIDELTSEEMGRHFRPELGDVSKVTAFNWNATFPRMSEEEAIALCLDAGAKVVAAERESIAACRVRNVNAPATYHRALDRDEAALHEPRAVNYHAARTAP